MRPYVAESAAGKDGDTMKGKNEQKAKWNGSVTEKRREAKRQKIDKNLKAGLTVEIIPARSELEPEKVKTVRVAAYCRVSTDQDAQTTSYEYQVDHFQKLVAANPDWVLVDIYADEAPMRQNGKTFNV